MRTLTLFIMGGLALCTVDTIGATAVTSTDGALSLRDAIRFAVENSPALAATKAEVEIADSEKSKAVAGFLPQLDLATGQGLLSGGTQRAGSVASLSLTENLFDGGLSILNYDSSSLRKKIADLAYANARDQLALAVAQQFARLSLNRNLLEVQEKQYEIIRKQHQTIESLYKQGIKTRKDYLRFTTEMRRSEIELANARIAIDRASVELRRLLGKVADGAVQAAEFQPMPVDYKTVEKLPTSKPDIKNHFQYRIATLQTEVFSNDATVARVKFWPQLGLTAEAVRTEDDYLGVGRGLSDGSGTNWSLLATIKWNLMDWGIRRQDIHIADQRKLVQERQIKDRLNLFTAENENLMLNVRQSLSNFNLSKELLDLEAKTYEFLQVEYQNGKVTYLDLIVGLRDLLNARVKLFTSYFELHQLMFQYRYHEGRLYDSIESL